MPTRFAPTISTPRTWAETVNFPAGGNPWNGNPLKLDPVANYFTPNEKPPAEDLNFLFNDTSRRLGEARSDGRLLAAYAQMQSLGTLTVATTENLRCAAMTANGRVFRLEKHGTTNLYNFTRVATGGVRYPFASIPITAGNLAPNVLVPNGEKVLIGDSPSAYIYDADAGTFGASIDPGAAQTLVDAIPTTAGNWLALYASASNFAAGTATSTKRGPRAFVCNTTTTFQVRTVSQSAVGADTAGGGIPAAIGAGNGFTTGDDIRVSFIRAGEGTSNVFFMVSGNVGSHRAAAYSSNNGATWTARTLPDPYAGNDCTWAVEWCELTSRLVLVVSRGGNATATYYSPDYGANFYLIASKSVLSPAVFSFNPYDIARMSSGVLVGISNAITDMVAANYRPIHASVDGGVTWAHVAQIPSVVGQLQGLSLRYAHAIAIGGHNGTTFYSRPALGGFAD